MRGSSRGSVTRFGRQGSNYFVTIQDLPCDSCHPLVRLEQSAQLLLASDLVQANLGTTWAPCQIAPPYLGSPFGFGAMLAVQTWPASAWHNRPGSRVGVNLPDSVFGVAKDRAQVNSQRDYSVKLPLAVSYPVGSGLRQPNRTRNPQLPLNQALAAFIKERVVSKRVGSRELYGRSRN